MRQQITFGLILLGLASCLTIGAAAMLSWIARGLGLLLGALLSAVS